MKVRFILFFFCATTVVSCHKSEFQVQKITDTPGASVENKFFNSHRSGDLQENAVVEFVRGANKKNPFVQATVNRIGYPRWDKMIKSQQHIKSLLVAPASTKQTHAAGSSQSNYDIYYVPFVRDTQNYVNASMVVKMSGTDTSISYLCDWQYKALQNDNSNLNNAAANFAVFFMYLDKGVFGHTKFQILDKSIFRTNGHSPESVELSSHTTGGVKVNLMELEQFCQDVTFSWNDCPFLSSNRLCMGQTYCDHCPEYCTASLSYSYCWQDWVESGGGGGGDGGGGSGGAGDGGGGGGGGSIPPDPCGGTPVDGQAISSADKNHPVVKANRLPCSSDPGWVPDPYAPEQLQAIGDQNGWYWDDPANFTPVETYDPNRDGPYRQDGFRRNGSVKTFAEGTVQNWINDAGKKIATFINRTTGDAIDFPDAYISDFFTPYNRGYTTSDGTIHADNTFSLAGLQHEYGHVLQIAKYGVTEYKKTIMPASLINMIIDPANHAYFWTETNANRLAVGFFGAASSIASKPEFYPLN